MEKGSFYFFTASILNWVPIFDKNERKEIILSSMEYLVSNKQVQISAFVIMPNHIHLLWKPLETNVQLKFIKFTGQQLKFHLEKYDSHLLTHFRVNKTDRQYQIWQRNPLAIEMYSRAVTEQKFDYIHKNSCKEKWKLASNPMDYPFSSCQFYENGESQYSFLTHYIDILG